jgi:nucleoside 2-deoxyribosyltransferase
MMADDLTKSKEWRQFVRHVRESVVPKISDSEVMVSIAESRDDFDVRQAVEIGVAMLLDKPMVLVVPEGRQAPARLVRAADKVIYASVDSEEGRQQILDGLRAYFKQ